MPKFNPNIPIAQRYEQLVEHWKDFISRPDARTCIWLIEPEELQMIESFYRAEASVQGKTTDIFFRFSCPLKLIDDYGKDLVAELREQIHSYREEARNEALDIKWEPQPWNHRNSSSKYFLDNFYWLAQDLNISSTLVAYLAPSEFVRPSIWEAWLIECLKIGIPANVRLMVTEVVDDGKSKFKNLLKRYPTEVCVIQPELDMTGAMKEVAAAGDLSHPGVKFQMAFIDLTQMVGKGQMEKAEKQSVICLDLVKQIEDAQHLQVAVYFTLAAGWIGKRRYDRTLEAYDTACMVAENMYRTKQAMGLQLLTQALFAKASVFVSPDKSVNDYEAGYLLYKKVTEVGEELPDNLIEQLPENVPEDLPTANPTKIYNLMEAWRMMGYCKMRLKEYDISNKCYEKALEFGGLLPFEQRQDSTLPYIGKALIDLNPELKGTYQDELKIRKKLTQIMGENWESKLVNNKSEVA
ncbi:hypothetical protein [Flavilitoribacter nigricans]|uniref:Tetratricopeptide repeat protein n=1 Tax=Flavilitoribacter nigricans (strain ATCC 23147 / DSM 23189 / NBRC 102662 / NCIMB 1420 / SS-2) TaxID=1122177 RepID=A0A2D0N9F5_FLAN2|nr:hypothetical protein [Flavilitoribacter nigricans]PHN05117.1 hypothetical protein CRP01_19030 [Flavilitoribacter nigricans DSM 23189 = NBRC 102662]